MAENKTKPTSASVAAFLNKVENSKLRGDCFKILDLMEASAKTKPVMWGDSIIGFGNFHYLYESGREGNTPVIGFSPRKQNISIYLMCGIDHLKSELENLGNHKTGKGCLYIKYLDEIDISILKKIFIKGWKFGNQQKKYGC